MKKYCALMVLAVVVSANTAFAQIDTVSNLPTSDKLYGLSKFWSEASQNFAYFDHAKINWDSTYRAFIPQIIATKSTWQYYRVMSRFCALLKDGHTDIDFPTQLLKPKSSRYKWIYIENFDKKLIVTDVPAQYKDKIPLGSELIGVDGIPAKQYAEKEIIPYISSSTEHVLWDRAAGMMFYGEDTSRVWHLKLRSPAGKIIDHDYQYHSYRAKWERKTTTPPYQLLNFKVIDGIGYLKLSSFGDDSLIDKFKAVLPQLYTCKGVIIDIRNNGGGDGSIGAEILKYFTDEKTLVGSAWKTRENIAAFKAWGINNLSDTTQFDKMDPWQQRNRLSALDNYWYKGGTTRIQNNITDKKISVPLIVLCNHNTASAAEDFLIMLSQLKGRATVIGQRTYGSTGQPMPLKLPGLEARICAKRDTYPDGKDFVGVGIIPDIEAPQNVNDVLKGTDSELEVALKEIKSKIH